VQCQFAALMGKASDPFATVEITVNSFLSAGIFPFRPIVFRDNDFAVNHKNIKSSLVVQEEQETSFVTLPDITLPDF
jgi:hypothetical protein